MKNLSYDVIFFTGAGISQESGIPTFGEQEGLRDKLTRSYALKHPEDFRETIKQMKEKCLSAEPNPAHIAIAKTGAPVITMNIDGLHGRAGSNHNLYEIHGRLPDDHELYASNYHLLHDIPVLYDDPAPLYDKAKRLVRCLNYANSYFVIVGVSFYTLISETLLSEAQKRRATIVMINDNAATKVPAFCRSHPELFSNFEM